MHFPWQYINFMVCEQNVWFGSSFTNNFCMCLSLKLICDILHFIDWVKGKPFDSSYIFAKVWCLIDVTEQWERRTGTHSAELQASVTGIKSPTGHGKRTIHRPDRSQSPLQPVSIDWSPVYIVMLLGHIAALASSSGLLLHMECHGRFVCLFGTFLSPVKTAKLIEMLFGGWFGWAQGTIC